MGMMLLSLPGPAHRKGALFSSTGDEGLLFLLCSLGRNGFFTKTFGVPHSSITAMKILNLQQLAPTCFHQHTKN